MGIASRRFLVAATAGLLLTSVGCTGPFYWPWEKRDVVDPALYEKSASYRVEKVKKTCEGIAKKSATEQDQIATEFGRSFSLEQDPIVRLEMMRGLAASTSEISTAVFALGMKDNHVAVRLAACESLGRHGGPGSIRALSEAVNSDTNIDVRLAATRALGKHKDPTALPALATALEDRDPALQFSAMEAMRGASGQNVGDQVEDWRQFAQKNVPQSNQAIANRPANAPK